MVKFVAGIDEAMTDNGTGVLTVSDYGVKSFKLFISRSLPSAT